MLLTLGAAGATVLAMLAVVGIPALDACRSDARGLVGCLRGIVDDKFDLGLEPQLAPAPAVAPPETATIAETPIGATTEPLLQVAEAPVVQSTPEPSRSLAPLVSDKPPALAVAPPQIVADQPVEAPPEALPAVVETADVEQPDAAPAPDAPVDVQQADIALAPDVPAAVTQSDATPVSETIALAEIVEPDAPSFVPPPPSIALDGVPPDLQVAAASPDPAPSGPAPDFGLPATPELPNAPPPDLVAVAKPVLAETANAPELPAPEPPGSPVPAQLVAEPTPGFVLPATPELPTTPPPELTVGAIDPVVPDDPLQPAAAVLTPTIDAVEIDGDGNFIAGNGPAGATMRLYVDGLPVGISPVEGGRWLVEGIGLLTEPQQTLKVEALDAVTGKVIGEATVDFERPVEPIAEEPEAPAAEAPAPIEATPAEERPDPLSPAVEPQAISSEPEAPAAPVAVEGPAAAELPAVIAEPPEAAIPAIAPVIPAGESTSVTILKPVGTPEITTLTTGAPSDDAVVTLGAVAPKSPAIIAHFTLPRLEVAATDVTVLRAVPIGDPGAGRFVSGKAIIRRGDTLWDIAHRYYGHGIHYRTIFRANRELIARPGKIYPGQVFELPLVYDD